MPLWIIPVRDISFEIPAVSKLLSFAPESSFCPCLIYSLEAPISNRFLISDPLSSSCLPLLSSAALMPTLKHKESAQFCFLLLKNETNSTLLGINYIHGYEFFWIQSNTNANHAVSQKEGEERERSYMHACRQIWEWDLSPLPPFSIPLQENTGRRLAYQGWP